MPQLGILLWMRGNCSLCCEIFLADTNWFFLFSLFWTVKRWYILDVVARFSDSFSINIYLSYLSIRDASYCSWSMAWLQCWWVSGLWYMASKPTVQTDCNWARCIISNSCIHYLNSGMNGTWYLVMHLSKTSFPLNFFKTLFYHIYRVWGFQEQRPVSEIINPAMIHWCSTLEWGFSKLVAGVLLITYTYMNQSVGQTMWILEKYLVKWFWNLSQRDTL